MALDFSDIGKRKPLDFSDIPHPNAPVVLSSARPDYNSVLDAASKYELPPEDVEAVFNPLDVMMKAVADPQDIDVGLDVLPFKELPQIGAAPERKLTFLESILGFTYPAKPPGWDKASPIEKFNFATLPISDFLGRAGSKITNDWRLTNKEETQKLLASEYHDTLRWYQKSPEVIGWGMEQIAEYATLKTVFAVSGLSDVLTAAGQKAAAPFISKEIVAAGGAQTLKTLSGAGIRNLLKRGLVNFLAAAPENIAFVGSWSALNSAMAGNSPKEIALDTAKGGGWALAFTAGLATLGPIAETPEVQGALHKAFSYLARKYPRVVDFASRPIEQEVVDQTVKAYGEHIGQDIRFTELPANVQAGFRNVARAVKEQIIKAAQKEEALKTYWGAKIVKEAVVLPLPPPIAAPTPEQEIIGRIESPIARPTVMPTGAKPPSIPSIPVVSKVVEDVAESGGKMFKAIRRGASDLVKSLEFYPDIPNDLRNDIRTEVVGAIGKARDDVYNKMANYVWGGLKEDDVQKSVEIIFAKDQLSRTQLGKGNPEIGLEDAYAFLDDAMTEVSPEVIVAAGKWKTVSDKFTEKLIRSGKLDEEQLIQDYVQHFTLDYTPDWKFNVGIPTRLKRPFRGYLKEAKGSIKDYQQDKDALLGSLLIKQHDNIIEDFVENQAAKYDIKGKIPKVMAKRMFGADKAGRTLPPKPGRIYEYKGKRYRAYTPDTPFNRQMFPTEEGLMALGRYKNASLIPEEIYNLFKDFSERGSRPVYLINRATSIWKSMAILSHFPSFNVNNMVGDTWMAMSQHPTPLSLLAEYTTSIQYLTGKGTGPEFDRLHKFIIDNDVLTGTFAAAEMAQMRTSKNPLAWLLEKTQEFSNFREGINRVAYASSLLKAAQRGESQQMIDAHNWINTDGLDEDAALGKIARNVLVDYAEVSKTFRRFIRGGIAPFATWYAKGSQLIWSWARKHWGKALAVFMGPPVVAAIYNHRTEEINKLEQQLPDYVRNRTHFVLGENPDGTTRVWSFQLPQDALIGTKIFSILGDYTNRVYNKEMTADEAALLALRSWGIKEAKGLAFLTAPLIRYISGRMSANHRDPYDGAPIYKTDPTRMTWWDRKKDESLFFLKTMTPFLSASIGDYEKGLPADVSFRKLLDRLAGKGAIGIYDVNKQGKLVLERDGEKYEFDYDQVAQIHYIAAKEERLLDKVEREFIASGLSPDKFLQTSLAVPPLLDVYDIWAKFEPDLAKQQFASDSEKALAVAEVLGTRFTNRLTDFAVIKKWFNVKMARADTDEEKIALRKELEQVQSIQMLETLKRLPVTGRAIGINAVFQESKLPWEIILEIGTESAVKR